METWYEVDLVSPSEPNGLRAMFDRREDAWRRFERHAWLWRRMPEPYILTIHECWRDEKGRQGFRELAREDAGLDAGFGE